MANDFDQLAMQGEDTGVADPERHSIIVTDDSEKQRTGEPIYYTPTCSCGWRGERCAAKFYAWHIGDEHVLGAA
jgi:hypothetical protein